MSWLKKLWKRNRKKLEYKEFEANTSKLFFSSFFFTLSYETHFFFSNFFFILPFYDYLLTVCNCCHNNFQSIRSKTKRNISVWCFFSGKAEICLILKCHRAILFKRFMCLCFHAYLTVKYCSIKYGIYDLVSKLVSDKSDIVKFEWVNS